MSTVQEDLGGAVQRDLELLTDAVSPDALGEEMADYLIAAIPQFARRTDEDFRVGTVLSCQSNLNAIWQQLLRGAAGDQIGPPSDAIAWAHELVHRGMDLAALLRAYRLGHGLVEKRFEEAASKLEIAPEVRWRVLAHASRYIFAYVTVSAHSSSKTLRRNGPVGSEALRLRAPSWWKRSSTGRASSLGPQRPRSATTSAAATSASSFGLTL